MHVTTLMTGRDEGSWTVLRPTSKAAVTHALEDNSIHVSQSCFNSFQLSATNEWQITWMRRSGVRVESFHVMLQSKTKRSTFLHHPDKDIRDSDGLCWAHHAE